MPFSGSGMDLESGAVELSTAGQRSCRERGRQGLTPAVNTDRNTERQNNVRANAVIVLCATELLWLVVFREQIDLVPQDLWFNLGTPPRRYDAQWHAYPKIHANTLRITVVAFLVGLY